MLLRVQLITLLVVVALAAIALVVTSSGQAIANSSTSLRLVDEFGPGLTSEEDRDGRFDAFFSELGVFDEARKNSPAIGYVLIYCGKICRYGEVEAHIRGIELKIKGREVPRGRMRIVSAGYRDKFMIELWIASDDRAAPPPTPTLNIKHVTFTKATKRIVVSYDCCDDIDGKTFNP